MQLFAWHLEYNATLPCALHVIRHELASFMHHEHDNLVITMYTGIWRLFADNCLDHLIHQATGEEDLLFPQGQTRTLRQLQGPVTWVLMYLGVRDMHYDAH